VHAKNNEVTFSRRQDIVYDAFFLLLYSESYTPWWCNFNVIANLTFNFTPYERTSLNLIYGMRAC
jgi:hypothetical protein